MNKFRHSFPLILFYAYLFSVHGMYAGQNTLYIGTGGKHAEGIYRTEFDSLTGEFSQPALVAKIKSPGFLAFHPRGRILYAVAKWERSAGVIGYRVNEKGDLSEFTRQACPDGMGCHLAVHPSGNFLLTAQYSGGSVGLFPLDKTGKLLKPKIHHHSGGSGVFANRQDAPHPHWCGYSPCGKFALIPDLGLDQIVLYRVDQKRTNIQSHGYVNSVPGGGPRHMRFSNCGKYIFLLNELSLTVETFSWDSQTGSAKSLFSTPTLTELEKGQETFNSAAEILVHPSGKWLFSSNRGHDSVTVYEAENNGSLKVIQKQPIRGAFPRNINLSPDGQWLISAGQDSNTISAHKVDNRNGKLTYQRGRIANVPNPTCLLFSNTN